MNQMNYYESASVPFGKSHYACFLVIRPPTLLIISSIQKNRNQSIFRLKKLTNQLYSVFGLYIETHHIASHSKILKLYVFKIY
jgi:hypothetical protein